MRILLDTHALLWWLSDQPALGHTAREVISDGANQIYVSAVSAWEIAIKQALGRLRVPPDLEDQLRQHGFDPLPITVRHGLAAGALAPHHRDPFDRMLVAQSMSEQLALMTRDPRIRAYGVDVVPA